MPLLYIKTVPTLLAPGMLLKLVWILVMFRGKHPWKMLKMAFPSV